MDNELKEAISQKIAERVEGKNLSQEQVEAVTAKVMEKATELTAQPAPAPVEPKFADTLFQPYQLGASLAPTGHGNTLVNMKPTQDYNKAWDARVNQTSYSAEQLQAEISKKN